MFRHRTCLAFPALLLLLPTPATADPARFIPEQAQLLVRVEKPRELVESFTNLELVTGLLKLEPAQELAGSTQAKRFYQFVDYFERELGAPWPELVDKLAGGGAALGVKYLPTQAVAAIEGTDEELTAKFLRLVANLLKTEIARTESPAKLKAGDYRGVSGFSIGGELTVGRVGSTILIASSSDAMKAAVDLHLDREAGKTVKSMAEKQGPAEAKMLLPGEPLAWLHLDYSYVKGTPDAKKVLETPREDPISTFLFTGILDVVRRSDFVTAGLIRDDDGFRVAVRLPAKRGDGPEEIEFHVPPQGQPGSMPLLKPKGTIFSHSFYLDFNAFYEHREELLTRENADGFEDAVKQGSRFLPAASIPQLMRRSGAHHRVVIARPIDEGYSKEPNLPQPSGAYVMSMRDPKFVRTAEPLIRLGAFAATTQFGLKMSDETHDGVKITSYRFPEDKPFPEGLDDEGLRFGYTPCFAHVNGQFIAASNVELCRELIDIIKKGEGESSGKNMRMRFHADGVKMLLNKVPDQLVTQAVLGQAIPVEEAEAQIREFLTWLDKAGTLTVETDHGDEKFELNIVWNMKKDN